MLHVISTIVLILVTAGVLSRQQPALHLRFMAAAFIVDFALVVWIEGTRHAVEKVASQPGALLWFHATISLLVLAAYIGQIALGTRILKGIQTSRQVHIALGIAFCVLRSLNYVTSFML